MINRVLIIEDEKLNADRIKRMVKAIRPKGVIVAVLETVSESIEWFQSNEAPDIVLLDVRLSDGVSFNIFDKVKIGCPIIFTTAYDEYAVRAFKYNSIDYLLKPVEQDELENAFEKLESFSQEGSSQSIESLLDFLKPKEFRSRFLLPYRDGYKTILIDDVAYFFTELKITRAKLKNGAEEVLPQTMEELEQQLNPKHFFRANRQVIIHLDAVEQVHNYFNGKLKLVLKRNPGVEVIVSRDKANLLKAWLDF